jgi:hypothetical protein
MKFILLFGFTLFSVKQSATIKPRGISGIYGMYNEISLAIDNHTITGTYQYYDKWNEKLKEFIDINVFYFQGSFVSDSMAIITAGWPGVQKLTGKLIFSKDSSVTIFLSEQPYGYNDVDFSSKRGVTKGIRKTMPWHKIVLLSDKTRFFNAPDSSSIRKGYLVKGDIVKVLQTINANWEEIDYSSPIALDKNTRYWIRRFAPLTGARF